MKLTQGSSILVLAISVLATGACAKKVAAVKPTPPVSQPPAVTANTPAPAPVRAESAQSSPAVPAPKPRYPDAATRARIDQLLAKIEDAYFDYDKFTLRADAMTFRFSECFWEDDPRLQGAGFLTSKDHPHFFTWWTPHPIISPLLTA